MSSGTTYKITGSQKPFTGKVTVAGGKNSACKAIIAALLTREKSELSNVPDIGDIHVTIDLLESVGVKCAFKDGVLTIDPVGMKNESDLSKANRTVISLISILIHFFDSVKMPKPDGCALGERSVNFHIETYKQFGLEVQETEDYYKVFKHGNIQGQAVELPYPSVGATETALFLGVLAKGKTVIENIAIEPEIQEIITMLQLMGAKITFIDAKTVVIIGVEELSVLNYEIIGDRLEVVSWAVLAAISNGEIIVEGIIPRYIQTFLGYFLQIGGGLDFISRDSLKFYKKSDLQCTTVCTAIYPRLATDQLAQLSVMLAFAEGISTVHETVFENRVSVIKDMLDRYGIESSTYVDCLGKECRFTGNNHIHSLTVSGNDAAAVNAPDDNIVLPKNIRCAHSYMLLASVAKGESVLFDPSDSIRRGYGKDIIGKLQSVGVNIENVE